MSAFLVGTEHIDLLVDELTRRRTYSSGVLTGQPDAIGRKLIDENIASVSFRYHGEATETLPGPVDKSALLDYHFSRPPVHRRVSAVQVLKAVQCYEYQSCEHPGWETSEAARWMKSLTSSAISDLPGYDEAAWEIS